VAIEPKEMSAREIAIFLNNMVFPLKRPPD
jgi:hypothetical protein